MYALYWHVQDFLPEDIHEDILHARGMVRDSDDDSDVDFKESSSFENFTDRILSPPEIKLIRE